MFICSKSHPHTMLDKNVKYIYIYLVYFYIIAIQFENKSKAIAHNQISGGISLLKKSANNLINSLAFSPPKSFK